MIEVRILSLGENGPEGILYRLKSKFFPNYSDRTRRSLEKQGWTLLSHNRHILAPELYSEEALELHYEKWGYTEVKAVALLDRKRNKVKTYDIYVKQ